MATHVTLYNFTDQGLRNIKDTLKRVEATKQGAAQARMTIKEIMWLEVNTIASSFRNRRTTSRQPRSA